MSGGSSQQAPQAYMPSGQASADQAYQQLAQQLGQSSQALLTQVVPQYQQILSGAQNNPFYPLAQQGAQGVAGAGANLANMNFGNAGALGPAAGGALSGSQSLMPLGLSGAGAAGPIANSALSGIPGTTAGAGFAPQILAALAGLVNPTTSAGLSAAPGQLAAGDALAGSTFGQLQSLAGGPGMSAAGQVLNTAFDPQSALFDRTQQRIIDAQSAINAMNGVQGPYAAGLTGQDISNFNIDWQNQQLGRQTQGLSAYDQAAANAANILTQGAGAYTGLSGAGVGQYGSLTGGAASNAANLLGTGTGAYTGLTSNTAGNLANLLGSATGNFSTLNTGAINNYLNLLSGGIGNAINAASGASNLGTEGLQQLLSSSAAPSNVYTGNQNQILAALNALNQGSTSALNPLTQAINAQGQYLQLGQGATGLDQQAASINAQIQQQQQAGLGQLFGSLLGLFAAPFTGGMSMLPLLGGGRIGSGGF